MRVGADIPLMMRPAPREIVRATALAYRYPGATEPAVADVSLCIDEGEVFGLLGPNGAGKTTTISMLCTLLRPDGGSLSLFGLDPLRDGRKVRAGIGFVPQDIALYPRLSARENLWYFGRLFGLHGAALEHRVSECLQLSGLKDQADKPVEAYSGGMKRRANLAAGIVHGPRLLFLDEPTVGIDPQSRMLILENLMRLKDQGMTLIYTTHYMEEAEQLCDRLAIVDAGRVIAQGTPTELVKGGDDCKNLEELFLQLTGRQLRD